ncbi:MAG: amidase [Herbiconiux sp.]|uniref:amidase n=1 Tax=Herbiconiux sp. TaxID=1871186 RepID=UPI001205A5B9|nr:amidase family protein [Herbiconiux sp.]TAJ46936.1 MAG: amidase [Herbiconiux sp.]
MNQQQEIVWSTADDLATAVISGDLRPSEIAEAFIEQIETTNPSVNAYIYFEADEVREEAKRLDQQVAEGKGKTKPILGVPYAIKGTTSMQGYPMDLGLEAFRGQTADYDAVVVKRLRNAGGLFLGRTNFPETAYASFSDNHVYGPTHNPWVPGHSAGGSSGGSAAAVAAGMAPLAEGGDGGGSIRIPASLCGVYGFKPSGGRIPHSLKASRYNPWICHGPLTRTVKDAALMMNVMVGPDAEDPTSLPFDGVDYVAELDRPLKGLKLAWSPDLGLGPVDPEVLAVCFDALQGFVELGAEIVEDRPNWGDPEEAFWAGVFAPGWGEEYALLDWESYRGQIDDNLIDMIQYALNVSGRERADAANFRGKMWDEWARFTSEYDLLITPTLADTAIPHGMVTPERLQGSSTGHQIFGWLLTYPFNTLLTPSASVPAGFTPGGKPVGLQISGGHLADALVLRASHAFEQVRPWAHLRPEPWGVE